MKGINPETNSSGERRYPDALRQGIVILELGKDTWLFR